MIKVRENVYFNESKNFLVGSDKIELIRETSSGNGISRICLHESLSDSIHQMLICIQPYFYMLPINQRNKGFVSYCILEGSMNVVFFDSALFVEKVITLDKKNPIIRFPSEQIRLNVADKETIFYEISEGPFKDGDTVYYDEKHISIEVVNARLKSLGFTARKLESSDYELIYSNHVESMRDHIERIYGWEDEKQKEIFKSRFEINNQFVVFDSDVLVARIVIERKKDGFFLDVIEISKNYRGRGFGIRLIEASSGGESISVEVYKKSPAINFYLRNGFKASGESNNHIFLYRKRS